jgi:hypothetical protein
MELKARGKARFPRWLIVSFCILGLFVLLAVVLLSQVSFSQLRGPGCVGQTVIRTGRQNASVRGSVIILDDGHSYENLGLEHETSNGVPWSLKDGDPVVVCPGDSPKIFDISYDEIGTGFHQFRRR